MTGNASKTSERLQRKLFRQNVHRIWSMIKSGRRDELSEKDNNLAEILMDHEEYSDHFENIDILDGREYEAGMTFNPFFHISTHQMVEDQLSANLPIETSLFCEAMEGRGFSLHEAIHFIILILIHVMYASASGKRPFDATRYKRLLITCKEVDPSEIERVIEKDFSAKYRQDLH